VLGSNTMMIRHRQKKLDVHGSKVASIEMSTHPLRCLRARKHHCSHVDVMLFRMRETHRCLEKRPVLIGHFVVVRSVLKCTNYDA
jgi:hypothetical protein